MIVRQFEQMSIFNFTAAWVASAVILLIFVGCGAVGLRIVTWAFPPLSLSSLVSLARIIYQEIYSWLSFRTFVSNRDNWFGLLIVFVVRDLKHDGMTLWLAMVKTIPDEDAPEFLWKIRIGYGLGKV